MEINKYRWRQFIATYLGSFVVLLVFELAFDAGIADGWGLVFWPAVLGIIAVVGFNAGVKYKSENKK